MSTPRLKAPWPYIGGKGRVARLIWGHLGNPRNYIEPFCGSAAVLLARPTPGRIETVNDVNHFITNAWRAIQHDPEAVAKWADWPVSEADLHARHLWLMFSQSSDEFRRKVKEDPEHYDVRRAGWWIWGMCCWIGSGWCDSQGVRADGTPKEERPMIGGFPDQIGRGVNTGPSEKRPQLCLGNSEHGPGVNAEARPQLADAFSRGRGVNGNDSAETCAERRAWLIGWMGRLSDRLRNVRICCGDWSRVCSSPSVTTRLGTTGIFMDPPYALDIKRMHAWVRHLDGEGPEPEAAGKATNRDGNLYGSDKGDVDRMVADVHRYCRDWGDKPDIRIVLAGFAGEHDALEEIGWEAVAWKASGYQNRSAKGPANNDRERLWISPNCCLREEEVRPMVALWKKAEAPA